MISDERLNQLIEYQNKWCAECELDDTEHLPGDGLWDTHNALIELAHYRRTFAKIEEMVLDAGGNGPWGSVHIFPNHVEEAGGNIWIVYDIGKLEEKEVVAPTFVAALSALAESVSKGAGQ